MGATYTATTDANGDWEVANITVPLLNLAYVTATATDEAEHRYGEYIKF